MFDDILVENKKIIKQAIICKNCGECYMAFDSINIDCFPILEDQPCPYCFISPSGKKFDKNGKEIK